jgi:hypothetical protein
MKDVVQIHENCCKIQTLVITTTSDNCARLGDFQEINYPTAETQRTQRKKK